MKRGIASRWLAASRRRRAVWLAIPAVVATSAVALPVAASLGQGANEYQQTNLISDIPGVARITDPNLVNPWGQATLPNGPLWVADNGTNTSTIYTGGVNGSIPQIAPLVVSVYGGAPTGIMANTSADFVVHHMGNKGPALFIFDSEAGRITAWAGPTVSGTNAQSEFKSKVGAVYKGLSLASADGANYLYATDFHNNKIDVFNGKFRQVTFPSGPFGSDAFTDPDLPNGYGAFGIQLIGDKLYVTYAKQDHARHDDVAGPGLGFVDVYDTSGVLQTRLISQGDLNSPWGLALAPASFGGFAGDLLVGNFGDGAIHAYDPATGAETGQLTNTDGAPIIINGLWGLRFGNGKLADPGALVFTAGIADESHGLLGEITPASP